MKLKAKYAGMRDEPEGLLGSPVKVTDATEGVVAIVAAAGGMRKSGLTSVLKT